MTTCAMAADVPEPMAPIVEAPAADPSIYVQLLGGGVAALDAHYYEGGVLINTYATEPGFAVAATLVQTIVEAETGTLHLVLTPDDLGKLRFEMTGSGDQMRIHLTVERPETLDLLRRNADQLLSEFRDAGYGEATLSFGHSGEGGQQNAAPPAVHSPLQDPQPGPASLPVHAGALDLRL
jgi:flagellar hook-length control protein FliK